QKLLAAHVRPRFLDDEEQRAFVPLGMARADDGRFRHGRMSDRDVFELDGADPFAAGFDYVLRAVGDLDVAVGVERRDVAGREPAVAQRAAAFALEVTVRNPGAA